jgi:hypothetical protein
MQIYFQRATFLMTSGTIGFLVAMSMCKAITINVPLFLEARDFMFFRREKHIISHFAGFFEGAETFLKSKLS